MVWDEEMRTHPGSSGGLGGRRRSVGTGGRGWSVSAMLGALPGLSGVCSGEAPAELNPTGGLFAKAGLGKPIIDVAGDKNGEKCLMSGEERPWWGHWRFQGSTETMESFGDGCPAEKAPESVGLI